MPTPARPRLATRPVIVGVLAAAAAAATAIVVSSPSDPQTRTSRVERATVVSRVSASGALTALTAQTLGFPAGSRITEVMVKVGDHVTAGQPLAKVDTFGPQQELNLRLTELRRQQAELAKIVNGTAVPGAQTGLDSARKMYEATRKNVDANRRSNASATDRARVQLAADKRLRDQAQLILQQCVASPPVSTSTTATDPGTATSGAATGSTSGTSGTSSSSTGSASSAGAVTGSPSTRRSRGGSTTTGDTSAATRCHDQQSALDSASRQVVSSQTALTAAQQREKTESASGQVTLEGARQSVSSAQSGVDAAKTDRPSSIAAQRASVDSARIEVTKAQRALDETVLKASTDATVSSLNGKVGDVVGSAATGTAMAPGSGAAVPASLTQPPATGPAAGLADPLGMQTATVPFITLSNLDAFQLVVPLTESDTVRIGPNRPVKVSFDAIPDLTKDGTVLAVAPAATAAGGAVSYLATIVLADGDPRLRDGLTATAAIMGDSANNVLSVPNAAVTRSSDQALVTVLGADGGTRQVRFQPGMTGDERTEVVSGLAEGQSLLVTAAQSTEVAKRTG